MVQTEIHRGQMCARSFVLFAQPLKGSVTRVPERRVKKNTQLLQKRGLGSQSAVFYALNQHIYLKKKVID